jgi:hypothetical protein
VVVLLSARDVGDGLTMGCGGLARPAGGAAIAGVWLGRPDLGSARNWRVGMLHVPRRPGV